jgi:hypothetical protein
MLNYQRVGECWVLFCFFHVSSTDILMMFDDLSDFGDTSGEVLSTLLTLAAVTKALLRVCGSV